MLQSVNVDNNNKGEDVPVGTVSPRERHEVSFFHFLLFVQLWILESNLYLLFRFSPGVHMRRHRRGDTWAPADVYVMRTMAAPPVRHQVQHDQSEPRGGQDGLSLRAAGFGDG